MLWGALALALLLWPAAGRTVTPPDLVIEGEVTRDDHETYIERAFLVPAGTQQISVSFSHQGAADRTTIDLGVRDPDRFRGWSGGARTGFSLSAEAATPGYLPGPLPSGDWALILGVPNIREGVRTRYRAEIRFDAGGPARPSFPAQGHAAPGWWRGDLHVHSGHSDGTCRSRRGAVVPCPLFRIAESAAQRGLDFVALTEHNATSHAQGLTELQPYFDDLLLMAGRELTTFQGHANLFGLSGPLEFRLGHPGAEDINAVLAAAQRGGAMVSVNHPRMPSGEACMGCGWRAATDWSKVDAIEVLNGGAVAAFGGRAESPLGGIGFWEDLLDAGHRLTAIAGSDSHDPDRPSDRPGALGRPATVVAAETLDQDLLLEGVRAGRVFVDLTHPGLSRFDLIARAGDAGARMGGALAAPAGTEIAFQVIVEDAAGARVEVVETGRRVTRLAAGETRFTRTSDGAPGWVRVNLRDTDGALLALGNPIYLNPRPPKAVSRRRP